MNIPKNKDELKKLILRICGLPFERQETEFAKYSPNDRIILEAAVEARLLFQKQFIN